MSHVEGDDMNLQCIHDQSHKEEQESKDAGEAMTHPFYETWSQRPKLIRYKQKNFIGTCHSHSPPSTDWSWS